MAYGIDQLPYLTLWKNTSATEEGYVTGLEPGTGYPFNRRVERHFGRVPKLKPGEARSFAIDFAILQGDAQVQAARAEIKALQREPAKVESQPVPLSN